MPLCTDPAAARRRRYPRPVPIPTARRRFLEGALTRAGRVVGGLAMGILLAVLALGLALDGSLRRDVEDGST
jgi:hypothetical protein